MSEAGEKIVAAMQGHQAPVGGWTMPDLRRLTGLSVGNFAAGVAHLRRAGRMHAFDLSLAVSAVGQSEEVTKAVTLAEEVAAEAEASVQNRAAARVIGPSGGAHVMPGARMQEQVLTDAPAFAASILKDRWGPVWDRVCRHARETNQRPIPAMIALLDSGLKREARP